jgi:hypothetical protein
MRHYNVSLGCVTSLSTKKIIWYKWKCYCHSMEVTEGRLSLQSECCLCVSECVWCVCVVCGVCVCVWCVVCVCVVSASSVSRWHTASLSSSFRPRRAVAVAAREVRNSWGLCETFCLHYGYYTIRSPVVTICTANLTFNNSTFCPHSAFICFMWIWEQTAIISL